MLLLTETVSINSNSISVKCDLVKGCLWILLIYFSGWRSRSCAMSLSVCPGSMSPGSICRRYSPTLRRRRYFHQTRGGEPRRSSELRLPQYLMISHKIVSRKSRILQDIHKIFLDTPFTPVFANFLYHLYIRPWRRLSIPLSASPRDSDSQVMSYQFIASCAICAGAKKSCYNTRNGGEDAVQAREMRIGPDITRR